MLECGFWIRDGDSDSDERQRHGRATVGPFGAGWSEYSELYRAFLALDWLRYVTNGSVVDLGDLNEPRSSGTLTLYHALSLLLFLMIANYTRK